MATNAATWLRDALSFHRKRKVAFLVPSRGPVDLCALVLGGGQRSVRARSCVSPRSTCVRYLEQPEGLLVWVPAPAPVRILTGSAT
jgi:hypothetical protein